MAPANEYGQCDRRSATTQEFTNIHATLLPPERLQEGLPRSDYDTESAQLRMPSDCNGRDRLNIGAYKQLSPQRKRRDDGMRSPSLSGLRSGDMHPLALQHMLVFRFFWPRYWYVGMELVPFSRYDMTGAGTPKTVPACE